MPEETVILGTGFNRYDLSPAEWELLELYNEDEDSSIMYLNEDRQWIKSSTIPSLLIRKLRDIVVSKELVDYHTWILM